MSLEPAVTVYRHTAVAAMTAKALRWYVNRRVAIDVLATGASVTPNGLNSERSDR